MAKYSFTCRIPVTLKMDGTGLDRDAESAFLEQKKDILDSGMFTDVRFRKIHSLKKYRDFVLDIYEVAGVVQAKYKYVAECDVYFFTRPKDYFEATDYPRKIRVTKQD